MTRPSTARSMKITARTLSGLRNTAGKPVERAPSESMCIKIDIEINILKPKFIHSFSTFTLLNLHCPGFMSCSLSLWTFIRWSAALLFMKPALLV